MSVKPEGKDHRQIPTTQMTEDSELTATEQEFYEHHRFVVDPGQELLRVDKYLFSRVKVVSRTRIQAAADTGLSKPVHFRLVR